MDVHVVDAQMEVWRKSYGLIDEWMDRWENIQNGMKQQQHINNFEILKLLDKFLIEILGKK